MQLWQPSQAQIDTAVITRFAQQQSFGGNNYQALHRWSITQSEDFWSALWDFCAVIGDKGNIVLENADDMLAARWFPDAQLNYAENLLAAARAAPGLAFYGEDKIHRTLTFTELHAAVSQCQQALLAMGLKQGDRVAALVPNSLEAIVAALASTALGMIWCSASPDFGADGVLDRFGQIEPKLLFCVDGYYYNGKWINCTEKNAHITSALPSLRTHVQISYDGADGDWSALLAPYEATAVVFERLRFDHPLFILFSSGTTGKPKCIVHGHGGTLLQHLKEHQLHSNVQAGDRLFYYTTCGWMMWNWQLSALASGAHLVLYDGNPFAARDSMLFDIAEREALTHFGTSAKFIEACNKAGIEPARTHKLGALRTIFSTGSPLAPESFRYVYNKVKADVHLASISGGTDIVSCFALGNPTQPVWLGELQCLGLGMNVKAFDSNGQPTASKGDLVCTQTFPSQPAGFWKDPEHAKYRSAYFGVFDNIWCHGDFIELTTHPGQNHQGMIVHGRSDAVLNPGGVRIGTAEIYRQVEKIDVVLESIVIGQQWQNDVRVVLFVRLAEGVTLSDELVENIKQNIRRNATPRHVPALVLAVEDIPRTRSGKIVELAVRDVIHGREVKNQSSLANPEALEHFKDLAELAL